MIDQLQRTLDRKHNESTRETVGLLCDACHTPMLRAYFIEVMLTPGSNKATCRKCSTTIHVYDTPTYLKKTYRPLVEDSSLVRDLTFYHWTDCSNWLPSLQEARGKAHVGSLRAAWERRKYRTEVDPFEVVDEEDTVHAVRLSKSAEINPTLFVDADNPIVPRGLPRHHQAAYVDYYDALDAAGLYVNAFEDPGSVSLLVPATQLEIVWSKPASEVF